MKDNFEKTIKKQSISARGEKYIRTDLAAECYPPLAADVDEARETDKDLDGLECQTSEHGDIKIITLNVKNEAGAEKIGKPIGNYVTAEIGRVWQKSKSERDKIVTVLSDELSKVVSGCAAIANIPIKENQDGYLDCGCVLIVGLGNRRVTADALGPLSVDGITVTRHIKLSDKSLFEKLGSAETAAITPGVSGQTGIETAGLVRSAVQSISPSIVIAIDALAARSTDRLGTTIQICDTGISPGSGIGNLCGALNKEYLGVPVIAIGVPTIVDSSTLVYDAMERAGINDISPALEKVLENGRSFFVSLKESDEATEALSSLIAETVGTVFGTNFE